MSGIEFKSDPRNIIPLSNPLTWKINPAVNIYASDQYDIATFNCWGACTGRIDPGINWDYRSYDTWMTKGLTPCPHWISIEPVPQKTWLISDYKITADNAAWMQCCKTFTLYGYLPSGEEVTLDYRTGITDWAPRPGNAFGNQFTFHIERPQRCVRYVLKVWESNDGMQTVDHMVIGEIEFLDYKQDSYCPQVI